MTNIILVHRSAEFIFFKMATMWFGWLFFRQVAALKRWSPLPLGWPLDSGEGRVVPHHPRNKSARALDLLRCAWASLQGQGGPSLFESFMGCIVGMEPSTPILLQHYSILATSTAVFHTEAVYTKLAMLPQNKMLPEGRRHSFPCKLEPTPSLQN